MRLLGGRMLKLPDAMVRQAAAGILDRLRRKVVSDHWHQALPCGFRSWSQPGRTFSSGSEDGIKEFEDEIAAVFGTPGPGRTFSSGAEAGIKEFEEEMAAVFGTPLASGSPLSQTLGPSGGGESQSGCRELDSGNALSHVDDAGKAAMVDVSGKAESRRIAVASATGRGGSLHVRSLWGSVPSISPPGYLQSEPGMVVTGASRKLTVEAGSEKHEVVIALGGNIGDRVQNFRKALEMMRVAGIEIAGHACLYESAPAYVTDQPSFLNSAVRAYTRMDPNDLLKALKKIENDIGRVEGGIRFGPRPIDLDIIFYGNATVSTSTLQVPHCRFSERPFVLAPLVDLLDAELDRQGHWSTHPSTSGGIFRLWNARGGEALVGKEGLKRVMPVGNKLWDWSQRTHIMGILNITPDSFSDGGKYMSVREAVEHARVMATQGADIIDVGAQSTRPNAKRLSTEEELGRLIPVLEEFKKFPELKDVAVSVDTFDATVAREAVSCGAEIINDVSGGRMDADMYKTAAGLGAAYVAMHMRGDPTTMQSDTNLRYVNVCQDIAKELSDRLRDAQSAGIPAWSIITDPGIGFAKNLWQDLEILRNLQTFRQDLSHSSLACTHAPVVVGPSRKKFLGRITGVSKAEDRDAATIAAITVGAVNGANIVRVHNVGAVRDALKVVDAICKGTWSAPEKGSHHIAEAL